VVLFQSPEGSINRDFFILKMFFPVVIKSKVAVSINFIYYIILILPTFLYKDQGASATLEMIKNPLSISLLNILINTSSISKY